MPRPRVKTDGEWGPLMESSTNIELQKQLTDLSDLLAWIAPRIEVRSANGRIMDRQCLLCGRKPTGSKPAGACRHDEIRALAKEQV